MSDDNIVKFLMPGGVEVSNDPVWAAQHAKQAHEAMIEASENTGNVGIADSVMAAQLGRGGIDSLQSGQGVDGEDYDPTGGLNVTGATIQTDAAEVAAANGFTLTEPKDTLEIDDSNEAALAAMQKESEARSAYADAQAKLVEKGEDEGDPDEPLKDWTVAQLKAEVAKRNVGRAEEDQLDLTGLKKKKEVVDLLEGDTYTPEDAGDGSTEGEDSDDEDDESSDNS